MGSLIFLIHFACLIAYTHAMDAYTLIPSSLRAQYQGMAQFTLNFMNFSGSEKLLMFGGVVNATARNTMLQMQPKMGTGSVLNISGSLPPSRYKHCSLVYEYKLYIFGGVGQTGQTLTDLWQFNSIFASWTQISQSPVAISQCSLIRNNTNMVVMGINASRELTIMKYSLLNNAWTGLNYNYGYAIVREGQLWGGAIAQTLISIENISPYDTLNQSNIRYTSKFTTNSMCVQKFIVDYTYLIITDCKILTICLKTMKINLVRLIQSSKQYDCLVSAEWLFVTKNGQNGGLQLDYYLLNNFSVMGSNDYVLPEDGATFQKFIMDSNMYFVSEVSLDTWVLHRSCPNTPYANVKMCFYGQIHCKEGYRGATCSQPICPNTLSLIDESNNDQIFYECSNHGTCTTSGCVCEQGWAGEDCSTYNRSGCNGQLMPNWPVMNCECEQQTLGGNACEVKFCYNDCSDHGKCLNNGRCVCDSGYDGDDCSVTIIQFPGSSSLSL